MRWTGFSGGSWTNIGTDADGTNGAAGALLVALRVVGSKLYAGGLDTAIGGGPVHSSAAYFRLRQPDGKIATTGSFIGRKIYNSTAASQTVPRTIHLGSKGTLRIKFTNAGFHNDSYTLLGPGSGGGFTATYKDGATNVTAAVLAGTYSTGTLAPGASKTIVLTVRVGTGVAVGAPGRSW